MRLATEAWDRPSPSTFADIERYDGMLCDDANKALSEIDQFSVSPKLQPLKDEFKLVQEDLKQAAYYAERSARNMNAYMNSNIIAIADVAIANTWIVNEYWESCYKHLKRSTALLSKHPKIGVLTLKINKPQIKQEKPDMMSVQGFVTLTLSDFITQVDKALAGST